MGLAYIDFKIELSRHERREREAFDRAESWRSRSPMPVDQQERLRTWFREWREHLWRCYDAQ